MKSRWTKIIIHDKQNDVVEEYDLDERQRLTKRIKQPRRKLNTKQLLKKKACMEKKKLKEKTLLDIASNEHQKDFQRKSKQIKKSKKRSNKPKSQTFQQLNDDIIANTDTHSEKISSNSEEEDFFFSYEENDTKSQFEIMLDEIIKEALKSDPENDDYFFE